LIISTEAKEAQNREVACEWSICTCGGVAGQGNEGNECTAILFNFPLETRPVVSDDGAFFIACLYKDITRHSMRCLLRPGEVSEQTSALHQVTDEHNSSRLMVGCARYDRSALQISSMSTVQDLQVRGYKVMSCIMHEKRDVNYCTNTGEDRWHHKSCSRHD
jgi:hypothetical protein